MADPTPAAGPAPSAAQTLGADRPSPQLLAAMERDLELEEGEASERLVNEAEAGSRAGLLRNALGDRFAGAWVTGRTAGELTVATTDADDTAAIEAQGATARVVPGRWPVSRRPRPGWTRRPDGSGPPKRPSGTSTCRRTGSWCRPPARRPGPRS
ncbi:hypothetical protein SHKM778_41260 [Streptomyces sp. KM77-8]|uniref:Uncharacterized protein n=1 Tax=Streptomyces haneummycinicus TaxID=3074435 RepID=A0AAT9HKS9_9ACTN